MTAFDERVEKDAGFQALQALVVVLQEPIPDDIEVSEEDAVLITRIQTVCDSVLAYFQGTDPALVSPGRLQAIASLPNVRNEIDAFRSDGDTAHLNLASSYLDTVIDTLAIAPNPQAHIESLRTEATNYRRQFTRAVNDVHVTRSQAIDDIGAQINSQSERLDELANSRDQLAGSIKAEQEKITAAVGKQDEIFETGQAERLKRFDELFSTVETKHEDRIRDAASRTAARADVANSSIDTIVGDLKARQDEVNELVGLVTGSSLGGGFKVEADGEQQLSKSLRSKAVIAAIAWAILTTLLFFSPLLSAIGRGTIAQALEQLEPQWTTGLARASVTLPLLILFLYLAREASRHQESANRMRRRQLMITSIGPYLADLESPEKEEIKSAVAASFYSNPDFISEKSASDVAPNAISGVADILREFIKRRDATG